MAKSARGRRRFSKRQSRPTPYPLPSTTLNTTKVPLKKDWEDANCSVCMEYPHNAVLLLCASHDKGCRPYMCGTSCRYSNCLDQYKKAYTKIHESCDVTTPLDALATISTQKYEVAQLACPLCRGQVKGWTVVEPARVFLNNKKRTCMHNDCTFLGTYKELKKHVKAEHPCAKPREVDPLLEQKWRRLEHDRERQDVISTIRASMPGSMVFGDYVIEGGNHYGFDSDEDEEEEEEDEAYERDEEADVGGERFGRIENNLMNILLLLTAGSNRGGTRRNDLPDSDEQSEINDADVDVNVNANDNAIANVTTATPTPEEEGNDGISLGDRLRRQGRTALGRSGRRRRYGEATNGGGGVGGEGM